MSMLAERKVKQKWSLNPRGKHWTSDQNKFGQKMLEKMGWSNGKGLGANLDGITEHVKVNYKNDSKGMGFKERDNQWTEHEDKFSTLLNSLSSSSDKTAKIEKPVNSLVEKSKNSRARIHYKKFTKGKDISQYSEKDLANVFGRTQLHKKQIEVPIESTTPEKEDTDPTHGVKTIMGGSMADYFKKKLANKNVYNGALKKDCDSEDERPSFGFGFQSEDQEERVGFGFSGFQNSTPQKDAPTNNGESVVLSPSKKKKKKSKNNDEDDIQNEIMMTSSQANMETEFFKKKRKTLESEDLNLTEIKFNPKNENEIEVELEEVKTPKKKCKKKKNVEDSDLKSPTFVSYISEASMEKSSGKKRKLEEADDKSPKKNKKIKDVGLCNPGFDPIFHTPPMEKHNLNTITEANEEIVEMCETVVKNKKKKKASMNLDEIQVVVEGVNNSNEFVSSLDDSNSKKKKKKNKKCADEAMDITEDAVEPSNKKKKKKRKLSEADVGVENACFNELDDGRIDEAVAENPYEVKTKKKKKKSKKKADTLDQAETSKTKPELEEPIGIDNPALNVTSIDDITFDMILNTTNETPKVKKPQGRKSVTFSSVNQEHIIPNREELAQQNELFDINTRILEESSKRRQKNNHNIYFDNRGFNMRSTGSEVYDKNLETSVPKHLKAGQTNPAFSNSQEDTIRNELDSYQSQVENSLNEAKAILVGKPGQGLDEPKVVDGGVILPFKKASFFGVNYRYFQVNMSAKGSYKHLIRGDIMVCFKGANMHTIEGYGSFKRNFRNI